MLNNAVLNIAIDQNIAHARYYFGAHKLHFFAGRTLGKSDLHGIDALIVRSTTQVDANLLSGTAVRFVGTATIGTDHIDTNYLQSQDIAFAYAKGAGAVAVAQYVLAVILLLRPQFLQGHVQKPQPTLGIVGLGNVGGMLANYANLLGFDVYAYDPFLTNAQIVAKHATPANFDGVLGCDIISVHTPLNADTHNLFDKSAFAKMPKNALFINSARGKITTIDALMSATQTLALDVYPDEPMIGANLLQKLALATPHIAGYSLEGKRLGTDIVYRALCAHFGIIAKKTPPLSRAPDFATGLLQCALTITKDDANLRALCGEQLLAKDFDNLRKNYRLRREFLLP